MVRGRVSCEEIIVDADAAKREMLVSLDGTGLGARGQSDPWRSQEHERKPSARSNRPAPRSAQRGAEDRVARAAACREPVHRRGDRHPGAQSPPQARFDRRRACRPGGTVGRHAVQDREWRRVGVDRQPRGAGARAQRAAHHVLRQLSRSSGIARMCAAARA